MKLVWSPETASKAYIDTIKSFDDRQESGVAELVAAMAAGWNAQLIIETWSRGGVVATSVGLAVAARHTRGRHVCVVPDEASRSEYLEAIGAAGGAAAEVIVGRPESAIEELEGIDFMVVDCPRSDYSKVLRKAKLSSRWAVLVCKNAAISGAGAPSRWRSMMEGGSRQVVRSVFLPVGKGLDIAHVASTSGAKGRRRWIKHLDQRSGEEIVIRK
ncbi:uncharacterized protein LOC115737041 [Rhodamnia argentea]|uniref:Uncharacterized protein LOC115737041 n=1 Tax=Rhodamnia argentea TaxID=178133 RepID=A0A8B8NRQ5_9MYRT|nr:uncharacterized protein LOC115737041 [Rhodamnia argentea]